MVHVDVSYRVEGPKGGVIMTTKRRSKAYKAMVDNGKLYKLFKVSFHFDSRTLIEITIQKRLTL